MAVVKRDITFSNIDNEEVTETWYFSLGKKDVLDMELAHREDRDAFLKSIVSDKNGHDLLIVWRDLLFRAVGKRVGNQLVKNSEVLAEFEYGGAFEQLLSEFIEDVEGGAKFFIDIMPDDIKQQALEEVNKVYTKEELLGMTDDEFAKVVGTDFAQMSKEHQMIAFQRLNHKKDAPASAV
jgi:hypothetical protein